MILTKGKLVEYSRQDGKPPVIASISEVYGDGTADVLPMFLLDENNAVQQKFAFLTIHRIATELLKPARKFKRHDSETIR